MRPLSRIETKWSSELAYAVGLITTDGSLSIDGRHIVFVSKDKQLLRVFKQCLGLKNKIGIKTSGYTKKKNCYLVQFGDVNFYKWLIKIGLKPNKTKTIKELSIPNKFFMDFLRGHFDGDGCFYSYQDKRWPNSLMFYMTFVSASLPHLSWLRTKITSLLKIKGHITKGSSTWALKFAKRESRILVAKMYHRRDIPCLERKRIKINRHIPILKRG